MDKQNASKVAFGKPGIEPRRTHANKQAVGTTYTDGSRVWFTLRFQSRSTMQNPSVFVSASLQSALSNPDQSPAEEFIGIPETGEFPEWQPPQHDSNNKDEPQPTRH